MHSVPENKKRFFERVVRTHPRDSASYRLIERSYDTAKEAFRDIRRDGGERYFEHLRSVALILMDHLGVTDHRTICAALLHDIVEDIDNWTVERVEVEFGIEIAMRVAWLTKQLEGHVVDKAERDKLYANRFHHAPQDVVLVKLADRLHNLSTLAGCTPQKRERFVQETRAHYLPLVQLHGVLTAEYDQLLSR